MAVLDTILNTLKKPNVLPILGAGAAGALSGGPSTTTNMPVEPEGYKGIGDLLRARATARLTQPFDTAGYEARGIQNVNDAFSGADMALQNKLTSSGLATSPVAGAANANFESKRAGGIAQFLNTIPEVQRQADMQDFGQVADFYNSRPLGQTQESSQPGGRLGSAAGGVLEMLGQLHGQGLFGQGQNLIGALPGMGAAAAGGGLLPGTQAALSQIAIPGMESVGAALPGPAAGAIPETASTAGGGLSGILGSIAPFLPIAGAAIPAYFAIKANQVHPTADTWVQGRQNPFDKLMAQTQDPAQKMQLGKQYLQDLQEFASKGNKESIVAQQALQTFREQYGDPAQFGFVPNIRTKSGKEIFLGSGS